MLLVRVVGPGGGRADERERERGGGGGCGQVLQLVARCSRPRDTPNSDTRNRTFSANSTRHVVSCL
eukprot:964933-Rhodomonas_salina.2